MRQLPTGTVTFLFTDIEGSTKLLHELGPRRYAEALDLHRKVVRDACRRHGGVEVDTQGDAFFVAFPTAPGALEAAREAQEVLEISVRMGIHTGAPLRSGEGYVGHDVHKAARIAAAGHGRQILVSSAAAALRGHDGLRDLGEHRLKDLSAPERIYQLGDGDFPPLKTLYRTNLPIPATPFIGRQRELAELEVFLVQANVRLLTLLGPGGTGKTRLALQAAATVADSYPDGVFWLALAPLRDPGLVLERASQAVGAGDGLADYVADKRLLLLLDNFEHLIAAAGELAALLGSCPNLSLVVTSRELLQLAAEQAYPVPPLDPQDGVQLFVARAKAVDPAFEPDEAVPALCDRLDNLPLALELAAARVRTLSPQQLRERLSQRLDLLKAGRDADPRQQTLRATIEWSHELLAEDERRLFARLAVFRGGCTLEAAEQVADTDLETLQSLVDKSLVRRTGERFWMLETIREFAAERLREAREFAATSARHAEHFRAFAEELGADLGRPRPGEAIARVEQDLENVRGAFLWSIEEGAPDAALAIFVSLEQFWSAKGCPPDFLALVDATLGGDGASVDEVRRAAALWVAGFQAARAGEFERPERLLRKSLELFRKLGKGYETIRCLCELAIIAQEHGRGTEATELAEQARAFAHELHDPRAVSAANTCLGTLSYWDGDFARAADLYEDALRGWRETNAQPRLIATSLYNIGLAARALEDYERAQSALGESLEVATRAAYAVIIGNAATGLGYVMLARGQLDRARSLLAQGLNVLAEVANPRWTASALNLAAAVAVAEGDNRAAARFWGAVDALVGDAIALEVPDERVREKLERVARSALSPGEFDAAHEEGRYLPLEQVVGRVAPTAAENAVVTSERAR